MAMPSSTAEKVQELTKIGNEHLLHHRYQEALKEFQAALSLTESIEQPKLKISCILNAGACLITIGEMQRGINLLQSALSLLDSFPSGENEFEHLTTRADIYYNIGVGNHRLSDHTQAAVQLKQSIDLYMKNGQQSTAGDAFCALALCYKDSGNVNQQEMSLLSAMELYQQVGDVGNEAMTCIELAIAYQCSKNQEKCLQMLTTARILAARLEDQILQGKIHNRLGLTYSSLGMYKDAVESLEKALSLVKLIESKEVAIEEQATILQNIGAVYNETGQYVEAIVYHKSAATLHSQWNRYCEEAKCLCNLATAHTQLKEYKNALESYESALNIVTTKDINDETMQFQVLEQIGSLHYQLKQYDKSVCYYKRSLEVLDTIKHKTGFDRERVMEKLSFANESLQEQSKIEEVDTGGHIPIRNKVKVRGRSSLTPKVNKEPTYLTLVQLTQIPLTPSDTVRFTEEGVTFGSNQMSTPRDTGQTSKSLAVTPLDLTSVNSSLVDSAFSFEGLTKTPGEVHNSVPQGSLALGPNAKELYTTQTHDIFIKKRGQMKIRKAKRIVPITEAVDVVTPTQTTPQSIRTSKSKICILS